MVLTHEELIGKFEHEVRIRLQHPFANDSPRYLASECLGWRSREPAPAERNLAKITEAIAQELGDLGSTGSTRFRAHTSLIKREEKYHE